ncbi:D-amino acid dehydrogenase small subunit [Marinobacterium lacunae]|uniref:D-amino acid dehydrogenase small subunit n=1 Tax=Marinobacterium lacunae TaxID=1232683 RepID=A0A081FYZ5_9GAMM|nr:D-amino acid dehydrogenase [Marinobacterium lacunae]KEA63750.1 D-amino acid dehydrogenase small subunit [Marinobacterium lacunae]MBR9885917.1 D-amino acid dehydrogenase [Oceanospirillales bacterium]
MTVLVMGAGVVGVTSAWYLAKAGLEVTVIDRQVDVALETSYANAGQISPGYSTPWAAPGVPIKAIKWMMQDLAPLMINGKELDMHTLGWMGKMLANCNEKSYHRNKERMLRVSEYSRDCLKALRQEIGIEYDNRAKGLMQLFRSEKQVEASKQDMAILDECGVPYQALSVDQCVEYEPALAHVKQKLVGGLRLPGDETGDCYQFTNKLAAECKKLGVKFVMKTEILGVNVEGGKIASVSTSRGKMRADQYLVALGSYSTPLLASIGIQAPVYPIKGYSLTLPIIDAERAPTSTVMDETYKVAVTRLGDRIRVGGTAEIASYNKELAEKRRRNVAFVVSDLFPGAGDLEHAEFWTGLRPMTPDGTPILGETTLPNLFLNTGHGTLGWTMSVGSAKYVADVISQRKTDISSEGLSIARYA